MYCRETTDAATQHINFLNLKKYFASYTRMSDRTPEMLKRYVVAREHHFRQLRRTLTNAGIAALAKLPNLRELKLSGMRGVTLNIRAAFAPTVTVVTSG